RPHGGFDVAESRQDDGGGHFRLFAQLLQKSEAVHAGHVQVRQDDIGREALELFERFVTFGGGLRAHAPGGYHGGQSGALADLVVYDENFQWLSWVAVIFCYRRVATTPILSPFRP